MKRTLIASLIAASFAAPAFAVPFGMFDDELAGAAMSFELLAASDDAKAHAEAMRRWSEDFSHELRNNLTTMYGTRMGSSKVVKNAPYSAEVVTETNQALADGNVISKKKVSAVHRDSEGRTRQETAGDGKRPGTVYISDPVESKHVVLLPDSKRAIVTPRVMSFSTTLAPHAHGHAGKEKQVVKFGSTEIRIEDGKVFIDGKEVSSGKVELNAGGKEIKVENGKVTIDGKEVRPGQRVVTRTMNEKETGDGTRREEVRVQVIRSGDKELTIPLPPTPPVPPMPPVAGVPLLVPALPPMPGVQTLRFESTSRLGKGVTTALGSKDFEGVRAEGKSTVWTIPAGEIGNRNPIQITSETWYSPDLQLTVYSRYNDPRTGESIYRLSGIRRAEPPKDLFTVPEGYDTKGKGKREDRERGRG
jgi:hypothetical protein